MLTKLTNKLKSFFKPSFALSIYMKSGNVIECTHVIDYNVEYRGDDITSLSLEQKFKGSRVIVETLALSQIEAVVRHF